MQSVVRERSIPEVMRALAAMDSPDSMSLFTTETGDAAGHTPEEWARAIVEGVPATGRFFVWRGICGLRLASRPSRNHIAGWKIAGREDNWIRIEAASWFMTAHIVFRVDEPQVSFATFVRYDRQPAAVVWPTVALVHHRAIPGLLRGAVRKLSRRR